MMLLVGCGSSPSVPRSTPSRPVADEHGSSTDGVTTVATESGSILDRVFAAFRDGQYSDPRVIKRQLPHGGNGVHPLPALRPLSEREEAIFLERVRSLPALPSYVFSGCNDRAHALWLMLPEEQRGNTAKVWLLGPQVLTLAFNDPITIPSLGSESPEWGYHVALIYLTVQGIRVLDPSRPDWSAAPSSLDEWVDTYRFPHGTVLSIVSSEYYIFFSAEADESALLQVNSFANNRVQNVLNNGVFMTCKPGSLCREQGWVERALARDEIAGELARNGGCSYLASELRRPGELQRRLLNEAGVAPLDCQASISRFVERRDLWFRRLWEIDGGPRSETMVPVVDNAPR